MARRVLPILVVVALLSWPLAYLVGDAFLWLAAISSSAAALAFVWTRGAGSTAGQTMRTTTAEEQAADPDSSAVHGSGVTGPELPSMPVPETLEPSAVARALFKDAQSVGSPQAVHIWLLDDTSGTLRLVTFDGPPGPATAPVRTADTVIDRAFTEGVAMLEPVSRVTSTSGTVTVWRYVVPVHFDRVKGVAAIDFSGEAPDRSSLNRLAATWRLPVVCALALYLAESRAKAGRQLLDVVRDLSRSLDPDRVVTAALERAMGIADAATGSIMLANDDGTGLTIAAAVGLPKDVVTTTSVSVGEGIAGWVAASGQPLLVEDLPRKAGRGQRHGVRSAISVPIADEEGLLGVMNVGSRAYPATFTDAHMEALEILARQTAVALRNARAVVAANSLYFETLRTLALAMETKDPYAAGGTERILELTTGLGMRMQLSEDAMRSLELAALLHDIGMAAVADAGTASPRPLGTVERGLLKMHPVIAAELLEDAPALRDVAPIVYHHHEHFDGGGYATGLAGSDIPLGARILAVADAFVAMTSDRPYRTAYDTGKALREMQEKAGTQFDPEVVEALEDLMRSESDRVPGRDI